MLQRAEDGRELSVLLYLFSSGILLGIISESVGLLALSAYGTAVFLNAWLLVNSAMKAGNYFMIPFAILGAIPAGLYDGLKVFIISLPIYGISSLFQ